MPRNLPPPIHRWYRIRVFGLFILAVYSLRFGIMYTPIITTRTPVPRALEVITAVLPAGEHWEPVWLLGYIWIALGVAALTAVAWPRIHNLACIATAAFTAYWTLAYAIAPFTDLYQSPPMPGARTATQDAYVAVFYGVAFLFIVYVGLTSRPATTRVVNFDDDEMPDYGAFDVGEHRV